jgi:hypothetical protein
MKKFISLLLLLFTLVAFANAQWKQRIPKKDASFLEIKDCLFENIQRVMQQQREATAPKRRLASYTTFWLDGITFPPPHEEELDQLRIDNGNLFLGKYTITIVWNVLTCENTIVVNCNDNGDNGSPQLVKECNTGEIFILNPTYRQYGYAVDQDQIALNDRGTKVAGFVGDDYQRLLIKIMCGCQYAGTIWQLKEEVEKFRAFPFVKLESHTGETLLRKIEEGTSPIKQGSPVLLRLNGNICLIHPTKGLLQEAQESGSIISSEPLIITFSGYLQRILRAWYDVDMQIID